MRCHRIEGWSRFLFSDGALNWKLLVLGGLSQGASHAGWFGYKTRLRHLVLFSGPQNACYPGIMGFTPPQGPLLSSGGAAVIS